MLITSKKNEVLTYRTERKRIQNGYSAKCRVKNKTNKEQGSVIENNLKMGGFLQWQTNRI
ncbi:hypothetical protein K340107D12_45130 [Blautia parvula]|uniref:Uncharacterized protein n=1 Tax=Blautia parvula TaxID=2877527 RepID=A0ABQ0BZ84_9FIRM